MALKNRSSVKQLFGVTNDFGAFANNEAIRNNPHFASILASRETRSKFKKQQINRGKNSYKCSFNKAKIKSCSYKEVDNLDTCSIENNKAQIDIPANNKDLLQNKYQSYRWECKEKGRYYNLYLQPTLFGNWSVTKSWGGIGTKLGNYKTCTFDEAADAFKEIENVKKQRKYKNYRFSSQGTNSISSVE